MKHKRLLINVSPYQLHGQQGGADAVVWVLETLEMMIQTMKKLLMHSLYISSIYRYHHDKTDYDEYSTVLNFLILQIAKQSLHVDPSFSSSSDSYL